MAAADWLALLALIIIAFGGYALWMRLRNRKKPVETIETKPTPEPPKPEEVNPASEVIAVPEPPKKPMIEHIPMTEGICANCNQQKYLVIKVENQRFCFNCSDELGYMNFQSYEEYSKTAKPNIDGQKLHRFDAPDAIPAVSVEAKPKPIIYNIAARKGTCANCNQEKYLVVKVHDQLFCFRCAVEKGYRQPIVTPPPPTPPKPLPSVESLFPFKIHEEKMSFPLPKEETLTPPDIETIEKITPGLSDK